MMIENNNHHDLNSSLCEYCHQDDVQYKYGEDSMIFSSQNSHTYAERGEEPFKYNYFLNLMIAPDINAYLLLNDDDIFNLPIHLQKLIIEAKEEIVFDKEKPAQKKLEKLKRLLWEQSQGDLSMLMNTLVQLVSDEGELDDLLRI